MIVLLNVLLVLFGLPAVVAPLATYVLRELAPSRTYGFRPAYAAAGGAW